VIDGHRVFDPQGEERMRGPHTLLLGVSRDIVVRDVSFKDSANYAILFEDCSQVEIRGVRFTGGWDGVHFRGWPKRPCRDVTIIGCQFYTGDDAIAGRYWENVVISDCLVNSSCNGIRLIGPASHLIIDDCLFYGPGVYPHRSSSRHNMLGGIVLQPGAWDRTEGSLDDVLISDVTMKSVASPVSIWLRTGNTGGGITVDGLRATGVYRAAVSVESWAEAPFTNVVFRNMSIEFEGGSKPDASRLEVKTPGVDPRPLPAWGFYARNIQDLSLEDIRLAYAREDLRPVLIADRVDRLNLDGLRFPRTPPGSEPLFLTNVVAVQMRGLELGTNR
jgi:polygalacturonase